jgi:predicted alpha/beta-fold hydrolase
MLTAMDDPFIDFRDYQTAEIGNHVAIHIEPTGGHMGYLTRNHPHIDGNRWLDYALKQAISKFLDTPAVA